MMKKMCVSSRSPRLFFGKWSISYMASLWRRNTTDAPTLHRINNVCCAVAKRRKILSEVYALFKKSFRDISEMSIFDRLSQKNDPHLNLLRKMNLPTPCWKNWNSFDRYAGCFNFAFSSGCYKTVHELTNELNVFKYRSEFAFFFSACKSRVDKVFKTFDLNSWSSPR